MVTLGGLAMTVEAKTTKVKVVNNSIQTFFTLYLPKSILLITKNADSLLTSVCGELTLRPGRALTHEIEESLLLNGIEDLL